MSLPVEKNEIYEMRIDALGSNAEGIGRIDGFTIFVEEALPLERVRVRIVKVKKRFAYGKLLEILEKSPHRTEPYCSVAKRCGGCQLQHLNYEGQLAYKTKRVQDDLAHIGGLRGVEVLPTLGMENPLRYRNKAQFPVDEKDGEIQIGFYARRSHRVVNHETCYLQDQRNDEIVRIIRRFLAENAICPYDEETHEGLVRHIFTRIGKTSGEIMVCIVVNGKGLPKEDLLVAQLREVHGIVSILVNENKEKTNVVLGRKMRTLWGKDCISDQLDGITFEISPLSFYQVNPVQTEVLYDKVMELAGLSGEETVIDLYCGIGTISLYLSRRAKQVFGVEIVPEAIENARRNAETNGIGNVTFFVGAAEEVIQRLKKAGRIQGDVVVVDPPRKGCDGTLLNTILEIAPEKIVYVSCNPSTLARDLAILCAESYEVKVVQPVDQFPMTTNVEVCVLLSRRDAMV